jgi:mono/diheme cytochrome c family protein
VLGITDEAPQQRPPLGRFVRRLRRLRASAPRTPGIHLAGRARRGGRSTTSRPLVVAARFLLGTLALCCATAETTIPADQPQRLAAGRAEYEAYCMACHGVYADGTGPVAPYMDPRPADLRRIAARGGGVFPHAAIEALVDGRDPIAAHGSRDMPIWGNAFRAETELAAHRARVRGCMLLLVS